MVSIFPPNHIHNWQQAFHQSTSTTGSKRVRVPRMGSAPNGSTLNKVPDDCECLRPCRSKVLQIAIKQPRHKYLQGIPVDATAFRRSVTAARIEPKTPKNQNILQRGDFFPRSLLRGTIASRKKNVNGRTSSVYWAN